MTGDSDRPRLGACGHVSVRSHRQLEAALGPLLRRRFDGDPALRIGYLDHLDDLRILATGFDIVFNGDEHGYSFASSFHGAVDEALAWYRAISEALGQHGLLHELEVSAEDEDGTWSEILTLP